MLGQWLALVGHPYCPIHSVFSIFDDDMGRADLAPEPPVVGNRPVMAQSSGCLEALDEEDTSILAKVNVMIMGLLGYPWPI